MKFALSSIAGMLVSFVSTFSSSHEISRRQDLPPLKNFCQDNVRMPNEANSWYHLPQELIPKGPKGQEIFDFYQVTYDFNVQPEPIEPTRHLFIDYYLTGDLLIEMDWIGTHPAKMSTTYITYYFTDNAGNNQTPVKTLLLSEYDGYNRHECHFPVGYDKNLPQIHIQAHIRPLGHK